MEVDLWQPSACGRVSGSAVPSGGRALVFFPFLRELGLPHNLELLPLTPLINGTPEGF